MRRTTSVALACVFRPTTPYTTCTPAFSSSSAQVMFACSSKRAVSSTSATTCFPDSAARMSERTIGLSGPDVRYSVCLIARTSGSLNRLVDERLDTAGEGLVRMLDEHVRGVEHAEDIDLALLAGRQGERGRDHRRGKPLLEVGPVQLVEAPETAQVERSCHGVHVLGGELELAHEQLLDLVGHRVVDLEAHHLRRTPSAAQVFLHGGAEILGLLLLECRIGIAGHAERVLADDAHAREEAVEVRRDDLLDRHEALTVGHDDEPRQQRRNLDARDPLLGAARRADDDREVQREIADVRERMRRVDGERREHREDPVLEHRVHVLAVIGVERCVVREPETDVRQVLDDVAEGVDLPCRDVDRARPDLARAARRRSSRPGSAPRRRLAAAR